MMVQRFANAFGYWADLCAGKVDVEGRSGSLGVDCGRLGHGGLGGWALGLAGVERVG
jgi:hypothetical protein